MTFLERSAFVALLFASTSAVAAPTSLCAPDEQVAFSCPIANSHKTVSLCLAPGNANPPAARYIFGTKQHPELVYPANGADRANFRSSFLSYFGATGGRAYSFVTGNTKYILYDVAGTGFENAGILVQPVGQTHASADIKCQPEAAKTSLNVDLIIRTKSWGIDPEVNGHSLNSTD